MCRITGFWDFNYKNDYDIERIISEMRDSLKHGGPDDAGNYIEKENGIALAHRRLAILDLSPLGHQPMSNDDQSLWIVFNGEVYNFQEIKKELEKAGCKFRSNSDTEVILKAYEKYGISCVNKFRGMFSIVILDKKNEELVLIRDRIGVKPLYWYYNDGLFMFASEPRAFFRHPKFKKNLSKEGLYLFFRYGYIFYPYSIWQNVWKLEPGSYLIINKNREIKKYKYWDLEKIYERFFEFKKKKIKEEEIIENLENILIESFKLRLVSDVPVGVFLSGGIDSSTVTSILAKNISTKLKTFTIGFYENEYDESKWAKKIADYLGTEHYEMFCSIKEALEIIPNISQIYDEPFGDSSCIPTHLVSKIARSKVKVILSGDGGDEFFGGYNKYWIYKGLIEHPFIFNKKFYPLFEKILKLIGQSDYRIEKFSKILESNNPVDRFVWISSYFLSDIEKLFKKDFYSGELKFKIDNQNLSKLPPIVQWMLIDAKYYLPEDILTKVDRASMNVALETREPLLDHKILEFVAPLPLKYKIKKKSGKYILKKILAKYLPQELFERPKHGFGIPQERWLKNELSDLVKEYLSENNINKFGILNYNYIKAFVDDFYQNKHNNHFKLWYLLVFQLWANKWLG